MSLPAPGVGFYPGTLKQEKIDRCETREIALKNTQKHIKNKKIQKIQKNYKTETHKKISDNLNTILSIFSANADGLRDKTQNLKYQVNEAKAQIFTLQETKYRKQGKFKMENFEIFEAIRQNKEKGGTMLGIHQSLEPVLIEQYSETFELIVAEIKTNNQQIRIMTGYGPQECWNSDQRRPFFTALEEEISKSQMEGKPVIIELDANSKLGAEYVKGDPHKRSPNGTILKEIIERHGLLVANGITGKSSGLITRIRNTEKKLEESVIDFVLISSSLEANLMSCHIDSERKNVLTKFTRNNITESDHNSIITKFWLSWKTEIKVGTIEIFNFKDDIGMKKFKDLTSNNTTLSSIFETNKTVDIQAKKFLKRFKGILHDCFKKIRITPINKKEKEIHELYKQHAALKFKTDENSKTKIENIEETLVEKLSEELFGIVKNEVSKINSEQGGFNSGHLWQLKKKLSGKVNSPTAAVLNPQGKLVTSKEDIEKTTLEHYKKVLENRPIKEGLESYQKEREQLCKERIECAKREKTPDWKTENVKYVIKHLKKKKSRDPYGYSNELIQEGGDDLVLAITKLMNNMKSQQIFPECLNPCNITSLFKKKGSTKDLNNYRGVFRVTVFRNILDKLIFNDEYENLDKQLTDSNVGGRKRRNIRDHIFVINAIMNSIRNGSENSCDITIYDIEKCFDSLWVQECINTMYENGLKNDKLVLLYEETRNARIAIKTSLGTTKQADIENIIMQGTVFGSIICTSVIDKLAKIFYESPDIMYKYKGEVKVPILGMVDDVLGVNQCSKEVVASNATINSFMELNKLNLSSTKCSRIHIGKQHLECPEIKVHEDVMKTSKKEKYLGDMISNDGKLDSTIETRISRGWSYVSEIRAILNEFPFGKRRTEVGLMLREAMFINGILYNSEAWHGVTDSHIEKLSKIDHQLMRSLLSAHAKIPTEFLYLETGVLPVSFVISSRRLNYLKEIHIRKDHELVKRVYIEQKLNPVKGDWTHLVNKDMENTELQEQDISHMDKKSVKIEIRKKIKHCAFT